ncbi:MAG: cation diffusion facilitator family transporter [Chitinophagales bacterium]|nr:cation diffusion facilitator family transporter [Chitinophagales bacterium]MDW8419760.1 cation diffusion facilitator family transporter [Chitinophagales bacterium]
MHNHDHAHYHTQANEKSTRLVVLVTLVAMLLELYFGYLIKSRTLIMDGWHMMSHVLVLALAWWTYHYVNTKGSMLADEKKQRIIALGGFASALIMFMITVWMIFEAILHFHEPEIEVSPESIGVAVFGLLVNGVCAFFLHREEEKRDVNLHAAYLHVVSDMVISAMALAAMLAAWWKDIKILDPVFAMISALIILKWSMELIRKSWKRAIGL